MKLLLAVVGQEDLAELLAALATAGFRATVIQSRGLLRTSVTVMIGLDGSLLPELLALITRVCRHRVRSSMPMVPNVGPGALSMHYPLVEMEVGGAVCFVLKIARFVRIEGTAAAPRSRRTFRRARRAPTPQ